MAGSDTNSRADDKKRKKGSGAAIIITVVILLLLGAVSAVLFLNVFNIRDKYLSGVLSQIPVVKNLVAAKEPKKSNDPYANMSEAQMKAKISSLQQQLDKSNNAISELNEAVTANDTELNRLRSMESEILKFRSDKAAFDEAVANGDKDAYANYYKQVSPDNAAAIYREIVREEQVTKEASEYIAQVVAMGEKSAARMLEKLVPANLDLVAMIFDGMSSEQSGAILAVMDSATAATIVKRMAPE